MNKCELCEDEATVMCKVCGGLFCNEHARIHLKVFDDNDQSLSAEFEILR